MKIKFFLISLLVIISLPTIALGGSFTSSLIQGKSPAESIDILASQIDAIFGRVEHIESRQIQSSEEISTAQLEIERLKLENENLKLKTNKLDSETEGIRAEKTRHDRCAELGKQLSDKEMAIKAPYLERIKPIQSEYNDLRAASKGSGAAYQLLLKSSENTATPQISLEEAKEMQEKADIKQKEIQAIRVEMDQAIKSFHELPEIRAIQKELDDLLCA